MIFICVINLRVSLIELRYWNDTFKSYSKITFQNYYINVWEKLIHSWLNFSRYSDLPQIEFYFYICLGST